MRRICLTLAMLAACTAASAQPRVLPQRHAPDDLEVTGLLRDGGGFISYTTLAALPQTTIVQHGLRITGIPLDALAKALGASPKSDLIDALCDDLYRSHYPREYIAAHRPLLALKIDGERIAAWAARTHQYDQSPYFITYADFRPRYKVLAHGEEAQVPDNVLRLNFTTQAATFGPLAPGAASRENETVQNGFQIAKQNCLRCHNDGTVGGTKAGRTWAALGKKAKTAPEIFAKYIHDPKSIDPGAQMPANPAYDDATLAALTAYFRTWNEVPR